MRSLEWLADRGRSHRRASQIDEKPSPKVTESPAQPTEVSSSDDFEGGVDISLSPPIG